MMKALILNSGVGSRMKNWTTCKCLVELAAGTTVFDAQIQSMLRCGVEHFYITTGHCAGELETYARRRYPRVNFTFINNPLYNQTNYIYSIQLARDFVRDADMLLLHGDLVFEQNVLQDIIASDHSVMVTDSTKPLPEKDFKAAVKDGQIRGVGVDMFEGAVYAQPLYKLTRRDWNLWLDEIGRFCAQGTTGVYAENALNNISQTMDLLPLDIAGRMCFEVDNRDDLAYAQNAYKLMPDRLQTVYAGHNSRRHMAAIVTGKPFIVCGVPEDEASALFGQNAVYFSDFTPNPNFTDVMAGISLFEQEKCDMLVSIGGGSAIDVAKCVNMLDGEGTIGSMPRARHLAIPTTAGTGSESTRFAVMYKDGEKLSVEHDGVMPEYVILDPGFLATLPLYHKKSALLDALCQAVESMWAKGSTDTSKAYALGAIRIIPGDISGYLGGEPGCALRILQAANLAGKAINISKTTAAHAMSYGLSTMFGIAHGHAAALCLAEVWARYSLAVGDMDYGRFANILAELDMPDKLGFTGGDIDAVVSKLAVSVNAQRLSNHPADLGEDELADMYREILS